MGLEVFAGHGAERGRGARRLLRLRGDNDLYITYVIVNPQADRNKAGASRRRISSRASSTKRAGITVRGAKMLGTASVLANESSSPIQPLAPGEED